MPRLSKRAKEIQKHCPLGKVWKFDDAVNTLKAVSKVKFTETCEIALRLGIDPKKSDQTVRGATLLPHGTGRTVRVAVLAQGAQADAARQAGAHFVGFDDLAETIKQNAEAGKWEFEVLIATPDAMRLVGQLGRILGPRGLMPNPKVGTVTTDTATAVKNALAGQVSFRADKGGVLHCPIGKLNFEAKALKENLRAVMHDVRRAKPSTSKGIYLKQLVLSSTMGPGLIVDMSSIEEAV